MRDKQVLCKDIFAVLLIVSLSVLPSLVHWGLGYWPTHRFMFDLYLGTDLFFIVSSFAGLLRWHDIGIKISRTGLMLVAAVVLVNPFIVMALGFSPWLNFEISWGYVVFAVLYPFILGKKR